MMRRTPRKLRNEKGQSTTEFMLMLPLLLAMFFFVMEMSLYFSSVSYSNYASYAAARGHSVGEDPDEIADMLLTGQVYNSVQGSGAGKNYTVSYMDMGSNSNDQATANGVKVEIRTWSPHFPFLRGIFPTAGNGMGYDTSNYLGPPECTYEDLAGNRSKFYDNNVAQCL